MSGLPELQAGVWRHWKGADYLVLGLGHDADVERFAQRDDGLGDHPVIFVVVACFYRGRTYLQSQLTPDEIATEPILHGGTPS